MRETDEHTFRSIEIRNLVQFLVEHANELFLVCSFVCSSGAFLTSFDIGFISIRSWRIVRLRVECALLELVNLCLECIVAVVRERGKSVECQLQLEV